MYIFDNDKLKDFLQEAGLTQHQLATKIDSTPSAVSHYINGTRTPHLNHFFKICSSLGVRPWDLIIKL